MTDKPWVLCVDDEPRVLEALEHNLALDFELRTADSGLRGLELIKTHPGCAVVISDMRMPGMNGADFLAQVRTLSPATTRVLLTGHSGIEDAIDAVNKGGIFRFLVKPYPADQLGAVVQDAMEQYHLRETARDLVQETLRGAVQLLIEVLSISAPLAFSRAETVRESVLFAGERLGVKIGWEVELAALMARLGWIAVPGDLLDRWVSDKPVTEEQRRMITRSGQVSSRLMRTVPRFEPIAAILDAVGKTPIGESPANLSGHAAAAQLLGVALELDLHVVRGQSWEHAVQQLAQTHGLWINAFESFIPGLGPGSMLKDLPVRELTPRMVIEAPIRTVSGTLLLPKGTQLTPVVLTRLNNFARGIGVIEPIHVRVPAPENARPTLPELPNDLAMPVRPKA